MANNEAELKALVKTISKEIDIFFKPELIQTGIVPLDLVLNGGLETGSLIELSGESQTGKSTLLLHLAKNLCEKGKKVVYIDSEGSVKEDLLNGVGLAPFMWSEENVTNNFILVRATGYNEIEKLIKQFLQVGGFTLFIIDSLTAMSPDLYMDIESDRMGTENRIGFEAQLNGRFLKQLNTLKTKHNCAFIFINQTRIDMTGHYAHYKPAGGQAVKFLPDVRLFMRLKAQLKDKRQTIIGEVEQPFGADTTIEAHKSRLGPGFIPYKLQVIFGKGCSNLTAYADLLPNVMVTVDGEEKPMLEKKSTVTYDIHLSTGTITTTRGVGGLLELIKDNYYEIEKEVQEFLKNYYETLKNPSNKDKKDEE